MVKNYFRHFFILMFLSICFFSQSFGQNPNPTPVPTPIPTPLATPRPVIQPNRQSVNPIEAQILREELRKKQERYKLAQRIVDELYRKPTKKELLTVAVDQDLVSKYADFLNQDNTGIIRLLNDAGCAKNSTVISASDDCLKRTMPGSGSSFSFREETYRIPRLADLSLSDNNFFVSGEWLHGLMVSIGDIALEKVDTKTVGLQYLNEFQPASEYESAKKIDYRIADGIKQGNFLYARSAVVRENETYLLRSVAYRGRIRKTAEGFIYNELDYDKRKDIIVAFRVARRHSDGSVTILWKEISSKQSPKILRRDERDNRKIKENFYIAKTGK